MNRTLRKKRTASELGIVSSGGITDMFDNTIKGIHHINDKEYDYLCEFLSEDEMDLMITESLSISDRKKLITAIEKHLDNFYANR